MASLSTGGSAASGGGEATASTPSAPPPLTAGWEVKTDPASGRPCVVPCHLPLVPRIIYLTTRNRYFVETATGKSQWTPP